MTEDRRGLGADRRHQALVVVAQRVGIDGQHRFQVRAREAHLLLGRPQRRDVRRVREQLQVSPPRRVGPPAPLEGDGHRERGAAAEGVLLEQIRDPAVLRREDRILRDLGHHGAHLQVLRRRHRVRRVVRRSEAHGGRVGGAQAFEQPRGRRELRLVAGHLDVNGRQPRDVLLLQPVLEDGELGGADGRDLVGRLGHPGRCGRHRRRRACRGGRDGSRGGRHGGI
ncbi:hypothetical protein CAUPRSCDRAFT_12508 [Caulochytrium protostelioides]|uniref:Uncharacterized protein n=1 Tax=Caulochytrium protostelioides TaxID=1555241 RepID=A0A4P9WWM7_9FUNG|nr:hypothetical protein CAUPRSCDRAFT_12508 [Caulochytrium protostelioides]